MIFGMNTTRDISKLSQITISKYHSWYLCQISRTNHAITYTYTIIQLQWGKNIYKNSQRLSPETRLYDITTSLVTSRLNKLR